jgi:hypothetical protein
LKITQINRNKLFFGNHPYKISLTYAGVRLVFGSRDIKDFKAKFSRAKKQPWPWARPDFKLKDCDLDLLEKLITFCRKYKKTNEVTFHRGYTTLGVYTSKLDILKELVDIDANLEVLQASIPPDKKLMYFSKEPPAKYRLYMNESKVTDQTVDSLREFYKKHEFSHDIKFSLSFSNYLIKSKSYPTYGFRYLRSNFYIDYNNDSTLSYLHLMFDNCLGKQYKLEKRP